MNKIGQIANVIKIHEGYYPPSPANPAGSAAWRTNNPGNMNWSNYSKSLGATNWTQIGKRRQAVFPNYGTGWKALVRLLTDGFSGKLSSYNSDMTLLQFFSRYAPLASGAPNYRYANVVSSLTGISISTKVGTLVEAAPVDIPADQIPYKVYSQYDPRWRNNILGFGRNTIGTHGCFITCLGMAAGITPDRVNEILKEKKGFVGDLVRTPQAFEALGLKIVKTDDPVIINRDFNIGNMPNWSPTIKEVDFNPATSKKDQHFVLRVLEGKTKFIIDPNGGVRRRINHFPFVSYRLFRK